MRLCLKIKKRLKGWGFNSGKPWAQSTVLKKINDMISSVHGKASGQSADAGTGPHPKEYSRRLLVPTLSFLSGVGVRATFLFLSPDTSAGIKIFQVLAPKRPHFRQAGPSFTAHLTLVPPETAVAAKAGSHFWVPATTCLVVSLLIRKLRMVTRLPSWICAKKNGDNRQKSHRAAPGALQKPSPPHPLCGIVC